MAVGVVMAQKFALTQMEVARSALSLLEKEGCVVPIGFKHRKKRKGHVFLR